MVARCETSTTLYLGLLVCLNHSPYVSNSESDASGNSANDTV